MAASAFIKLIFLILCFSGLSSQYPQVQPQDVVTETNNTVANSTAMRCTTARGEPGTCLDRLYCDYSTYAIDLSLYAPKGYNKSCDDKETCCPFDSQLTIEPKDAQKEPKTNENNESTLLD